MHQPTGSLETLERRKLMLACLLLRSPKIVLLDEPASGLTGSEIDEIDLIVRKLSQEYGIAVLLIEHRLELLAMVASRVLVLDVGQVIAEGPPEKVFLEPQVRQAYFDVPITGDVVA
jgi:ABC-type branched-subunit amino acid transport system ATPase component